MSGQKFLDESKREEFIKEVADYFIENNSTTRKTSNNFNISNFTIYEYLTVRLAKIDIERYLEVAKILNSNKSQTRYGTDIKQRLDDIYEKIFINNMTILETSKNLGISEKTIYNDILKYDKKRFDNIKNVLSKHSKDNSRFKK